MWQSSVESLDKWPRPDFEQSTDSPIYESCGQRTRLPDPAFMFHLSDSVFSSSISNLAVILRHMPAKVGAIAACLDARSAKIQRRSCWERAVRFRCFRQLASGARGRRSGATDTEIKYS